MKTESLPSETGIYFFYNDAGELLYVGKALDIRRRVKQHLADSEPWKQGIARVDYSLFPGESEALLAEADAIRRLRPKHNILLRDDKRYPRLAISWDEEFPRLYLTREKDRAGREYFGPYTKAHQARRILDLVPKIIATRSCQGAQPGRAANPCLDWHLGRCSAPCVDKISASEYRADMLRIRDILLGSTKELELELTEKMKRAADRRDFEQAALLRDRISVLRTLRSRPGALPSGDLDVLCVSRSCVFRNKIRGGSFAGGDWVDMRVPDTASEREILEAFLLQFYSSPPKEIVLSQEISPAVLGAFLEKFPRTQVTTKPRGSKEKFLLASQKTAQAKPPSSQREGLYDLEQSLGRSASRIECYDVSNIQGSNIYCSMAVFIDGVPESGMYRVWRIDQDGADDYAALRQAMERRHLALQGDDESLSQKPDLVLVDGGRGQLRVARKAFADILDQEGIISLAKKEEVVHGARVTKNTPGHRLLCRARDEAHRFALRYHRRARSRDALQPIQIPGVGPKRMKALQEHLPDISQASLEEIEAVPGISSRLAQQIYHQLHRR